MANIRIKNLVAFSGDPSGSDYLAIDSAGETKKLPANKYALAELLRNKDISTLSELYELGLSNYFTFGTATSALMAELTNGQYQYNGRFITVTADPTTVDVFLYAAYSGKLFIARIANGVVTKAYYINMTQISL